MKRRITSMLAALMLAAFAIPFTAALVSAHSGGIVVTQTCQSWSASVSLSYNVTSDRLVVVTTTIPGTIGIAGNHYNTSYGLIWDASGPATSSGTVTLIIYNGTSVEFTTSASLPTPPSCAVATATHTATATATHTATATATATATGTATATATHTATATATATATGTATASASESTDPSESDSPFQSFQGDTATAGSTTTPPPTNTGGNGSGNSSTPLMALLICLAFGGVGLASVEAQRRSIRR